MFTAVVILAVSQLILCVYCLFQRARSIHYDHIVGGSIRAFSVLICHYKQAHKGNFFSVIVQDAAPQHVVFSSVRSFEWLSFEKMPSGGFMEGYGWVPARILFEGEEGGKHYLRISLANPGTFLFWFNRDMNGDCPIKAERYPATNSSGGGSIGRMQEQVV